MFHGYAELMELLLVQEPKYWRETLPWWHFAYHS